MTFPPSRNLAWLCLACLPALGLAQVNYGNAFNPFTFEGDYIEGHYGAGSSFTFNVGPASGGTFLQANNLQDGTSAPNYHWAPTFGWQIDGYTAQSNTQGNFLGLAGDTGVAYSAYNAGQPGIAYPGNTIDSNTMGNDRLADAFNLNRYYSITGLASAPGLGNNYMDTYTKRSYTTNGAYNAQASLDFVSNATQELYLTLAFGGRDNARLDNANITNESSKYMAWFRVVDLTLGTVVDGSLGNTGASNKANMLEYYKDRSSTNSLLADNSNAPTDDGVDFQSWEYYKLTWNAIEGHQYDLQILLPEEINFDLAFGSQYSNITTFVDLPPIPEPSTYGMVGAGALAGLALWRRRRTKRAQA